MKLVIREPETTALARLLRTNPRWVASAIATVEVARAVARAGGDGLRARDVLDRVALAAVTQHVLDAAASLSPSTMRTLDAIHLATALRIGSRLSALVTYDERLAAAARAHGVVVSAPTATRSR